MSSIRRLNSFSLLRNPKGLTKKSIEEFYFPFGPGDMAVMSGSIGKLGEMGGVQGIAGALRTDLKKGLFADEVEKNTYAERKKLYGVNMFDKPPLRPFWQHAWEAWNDPILMLLTFSGVFSLIVETIRTPGSGFVEGLAIILAICLVVFVGAFNNLSQEKAFRELEDSTEEESFKVWRDGKQVRVKQSEVVVGDIVELNAGDAVPADGIFVFGDDPATNEAKMTGESKDIPKDAKDPFLLGGTELKRGALFYVVTAVGPNSAYGRIMAALAKPPEDTPLQEKLEGLANTISYIGAAAAVLVFIALTAWWAQDVIKKEDAFTDRGTSLIDFIIMAITILVVAVPEGLPLAVTLSLAYSMRKMVEDKNLVRVLAACETMGNCTAICSDKTGTLTTNKMTVIRGWIANKFYDKIPVNNVFTPLVKQLLIETIVINSKATEELVDQGGAPAASTEVMLDPVSTRLQDEPQKRYEETQALAARQPSDGKKTIVEMQQMANKKTTVWKGNQTEIALLEWLKKYKINHKHERQHTTIYKNYPFDSMKKNSSVIIKAPNGKWRRCYKGAAEQILATATHIVDEQDREMPIADYKAHIIQSIEAMTKTGLRTIAFAYEDHSHIDPDQKDPNKLADPPAPEKVVFVGTVGIKDPLRAESRASVRTCQRAGVVVRMVTGDHPETAKFIATECGILTAPHHVVMTGEEFRKMVELNPAEAERVIPNLRVLARSSPTDKQVLVKWLKERKHCVAATGDGTNDAPALKEADVGIAMFIAGTAVAKQAAQVLILDDNFASIVKSVMWGRSIFDNIRKFVQFQLTINLVALTLSFIGAVANYPEPLGAVQLLWVNLIMDTLAALALGTEPPQVSLLDRRPYDREGPLINKIMWRNMLGHFLMQLTILLILLFHGANMFDVEAKETEHYTIIFNTFVWFQIFNEFNARQVTGESNNVYHDLFSNKTFWMVSFTIIFFQVLMVEAFTIFARTTHLTTHQWFSCIGFGALSIPWGFVVRAVPVDINDGFIEIPPGTFDGANLEVHEPDELGHPHYKEFVAKRALEEQGLADHAFPDNASPIVPDTVVDVR